MINFTFLTEDEIFGQNNVQQQLYFNQNGTMAKITDFAALCGGYRSSNGNGYWWTSTDDKDNDARAVSYNGNSRYKCVNHRDVGCRPACSFSDISSISSNVVRGANGLITFEAGMYPQTAVSSGDQDFLERLFKSNQLQITGNSYTIDSVNYDQRDTAFSPERLDEYTINGKRYVRVINKYCDDEVTLSNGITSKRGEAVWVEVQPLKFTTVNNTGTVVITQDIVFAGVQFNKTSNYKGDFLKTDIKSYLDNYFSKDIIKSRVIVNQNVNTNINANVTTGKKVNPYGFSFDSVTEQQIIRGAVESGVAVLLHGEPGVGKSAMIKQLDPDCTVIYLRNASPDYLNGKSVYNQETGEIINVKPPWLKKLEKKCEEEPNKLHIIFLDEITNATPYIQGAAFNLVLDREVNGIWKLPENARIVAAGNELSDSKAANALAEPLFSRFAHVYIKTSLDSWLDWAQTPNEKYEKLDYKDDSSVNPDCKIHPAVYSFIAYRGENVLRTQYTGEKPNADPRKWELVSKMLYKTKNPEMARALVGDSITREFVHFCNQKVITLKDVIDGNYTDNDLNMDFGEKYATAYALSKVNEENVEIVRNFMMKIGADPLALFDKLWSGNDEERILKIAELRVKGNNVGGVKI